MYSAIYRGSDSNAELLSVIGVSEEFYLASRPLAH